MRKILKFTLKIATILFGTVAILFLFLYLKYNSPLPQGKTGEKADQLAFNISNALHYEAYQNTDIISWTVQGFDYIWNKTANKVDIQWGINHVIYTTNTPQNSQILKPTNLSEEKKQKIIETAKSKFNNDSFWLVAPFKLFDDSAERRYIEATENENSSLLITYTSGGSTPGDSYQWFVDSNFIPTHCKMWVSVIPIKGLPATWSDWEATETGILFSQKKKILGQIPFPITNIKTKRIRD